MVEIDKAFQRFGMWSQVILAVTVVYTTLSIFITFFYVITGMRKEVMKARGMIGIIPIDILTQNKKMRDIFLKGKGGENKKRRYQRRKVKDY